MPTFFAFYLRCITSCVLATALASAFAAGHEPVSADAAAKAIAQGAAVADVRSAQQFATGHLPNAVNLPQLAQVQSVAELARSLSDAGIDTSRTVLVVGHVGDPSAQALWLNLQMYASGRVLWLVGGTTEWQMRGFALDTVVTTRKAVPQYLVAFEPAVVVPRMAGASLRSAVIPEQSLPLRVSAVQ